jgi:hypothetical protein
MSCPPYRSQSFYPPLCKMTIFGRQSTGVSFSKELSFIMSAHSQGHGSTPFEYADRHVAPIRSERHLLVVTSFPCSFG